MNNEPKNRAFLSESILSSFFEFSQRKTLKKHAKTLTDCLHHAHKKCQMFNTPGTTIGHPYENQQ